MHTRRRQYNHKGTAILSWARGGCRAGGLNTISGTAGRNFLYTATHRVRFTRVIHSAVQFLMREKEDSSMFPGKTLAALGATLAAVVVVAPRGAHAEAVTTTQKAVEKPNVIMFFTDDMGYADLSSFARNSSLKVKTPNIDRLAKEGKSFMQFSVAMPICSPSRAAVLSGRFAAETGLTSYLQTRKGNAEADQQDYLDPVHGNLPTAFQAAGYATAHVGKWHLGGGRDVLDAPSIKKYGYHEAYTTWEGPKEDRDPKLGINHAPWDKERSDPGQVPRHQRTQQMVDRTLDFLKRNEGKPCFISLWADDMHTPFRPSDEMMTKHGGKPGEDNSRENYYAVLEEYDRQFGRLLDGLKAQGQEDNTIIFFTGDNGPAPPYETLRTDGMRGMKLSLYEGGIRQPFLIRWPGHIKPGSVDNETVLNSVDLLPTLTALAGIQMTAEGKAVADGQDMSAAMLTDKPVKRTKPLLFEFGRNKHVPRPRKPQDASPVLAIRQDNLKLLVNRNGKGMEMYDVMKDPNETTNIADQHKEQAEAMAKVVIDWSKTLPHRTHPMPDDMATTGAR